MKIGQRDIALVEGTIDTIADEAFDKLDTVTRYLESDFPPSLPDLVTESQRVADVLGHFAQLHMWSAFRAAIVDAIKTKGADATMSDVAASLTDALVIRSQFSDRAAAMLGPVGAAYFSLVNTQFAVAIQTCGQLAAADVVVRESCAEVASRFGTTVDDLHEVFISGNATDEVVQAVVQATVQRSLARLAERGDVSTDQVSFVNRLADMLGINAKDIEVHGTIPDHFGPEEGVAQMAAAAAPHLERSIPRYPNS